MATLVPLMVVIMISRNKDIIFLLGAGASAEAGIPPSGDMIRRIEALLQGNSDWKKFLRLYHHIKSAIHYAAGLNGLFAESVPYSIETLVNTLYELERNEQHPLYPFKLHGSINWKRDNQSKQLFSVEQTEGIEPEDMEVIFGREFKLEAADPYLFYIYEFRRFTLVARLVVCIGYGFGDGHINKMLAQALKDDSARRLLVVARCIGPEATKQMRAKIALQLQVTENQVLVHVADVFGI
jgi:hypothetical protein